MKFCTSYAFSDVEHYVELAVAAEEHGWDSVVLSDHLVHPEEIASPYPYREDGARPWQAEAHWPDVWVATAAMAAVTQRLRFVQGVYVLPLRHPLHVAKALGTAAVLSGYRVSLGFGLGWMKDEFELVGAAFGDRGARADEMVEVLRKLFTGEMVEHRGRFYAFPRLNMRPPVRGPVPILVGGVSAPALRRAARYDGWVSNLATRAELAEQIGAIERERRALGREGEPLQVIAACADASSLDDYRRLEEIGVTHLLQAPWPRDGGREPGLDEKRDGLRRFGDEVIAKW